MEPSNVTGACSQRQATTPPPWISVVVVEGRRDSGAQTRVVQARHWLWRLPPRGLPRTDR